jgi:hypothetical protein
MGGWWSGSSRFGQFDEQCLCPLRKGGSRGVFDVVGPWRSHGGGVSMDETWDGARVSACMLGDLCRAMAHGARRLSRAASPLDRCCCVMI